MRTAILAITLAVSGCTSLPHQREELTQSATATAPQGAPVTVPRARQFDLVSRINGRTYRVFVAAPFQADPAKRYPVIYLLDGNAYFATTADALTRQTALGIASPAIVVGVGYPTDDPKEIARLRFFDLTPSVSKDPARAGTGGGGDAFLRILEEELMPFVSARYPADAAQRVLWGQSVGGLTVLRSMFRKPGLFSTYILSSPSIWYNEREVLGDEASFSRSVTSQSPRLKILVTSAGDEQYRGPDLKYLADANLSRMVDNATELAERLARLPSGNVTVERIIFPGELHGTVPQASLSRTLRFAFPAKE
ncbi:MAG: alpha/beta hydrolase-fold protein [Pseudomonadota bacterium]